MHPEDGAGRIVTASAISVVEGDLGFPGDGMLLWNARWSCRTIKQLTLIRQGPIERRCSIHRLQQVTKVC